MIAVNETPDWIPIPIDIYFLFAIKTEKFIYLIGIYACSSFTSNNFIFFIKRAKKNYD